MSEKDAQKVNGTLNFIPMISSCFQLYEFLKNFLSH